MTTKTSLRITPLGTVAKVISGFAFKSAEFCESGVPVIKIKNIQLGEVDLTETQCVPSHYSSIDSKYHVHQGDILVSLTGSHINQPNSVVGRVSRYPKGFPNALLNQRAGKVIIKKPEKCNSDFLYYQLYDENVRRDIAAFAHGAANQANVSPGQIESLCIHLPPLPTQHKIASILSNYDELIENNTRRIKILEEMAQSIYREWFVNYRFPGHEKVKLVESALGMMPEGWETKTLGEIYNTSSGGTPSRKRPEYYIDGTINWVKSQELTDKFILQTDEHITEKALDDSSAKIFPCNTVLIALYGATIGRLAILSQESATNQACCAILPKSTPFGREFSFLTLLTNRERIINLRLGAAQQNISQILLRNLECLKPTETLVETFSSLTAPFFDGILNLQRQNVNLRQTRDLLLPRLISGEIDVTNLDIQVSED